jgi:hypothetical protein
MRSLYDEAAVSETEVVARVISGKRSSLSARVAWGITEFSSTDFVFDYNDVHIFGSVPNTRSARHGISRTRRSGSRSGKKNFSGRLNRCTAHANKQRQQQAGGLIDAELPKEHAAVAAQERSRHWQKHYDDIPRAVEDAIRDQLKERAAIGVNPLTAPLPLQPPTFPSSFTGRLPLGGWNHSRTWCRSILPPCRPRLATVVAKLMPGGRGRWAAASDSTDDRIDRPLRRAESSLFEQAFCGIPIVEAELADEQQGEGRRRRRTVPQKARTPRTMTVELPNVTATAAVAADQRIAISWH